MTFHKVIIQLKAMNTPKINMLYQNDWSREDMLGKPKYLQHVLLITEICITLSISLCKVRSTVTLPLQTTHPHVY